VTGKVKAETKAEVKAKVKVENSRAPTVLITM
jgi:hypothetical protein